jgi:hypothetical protein
MPHHLLIGAGFSRNWGGWVASEAFEYLLGCPEIRADARLRELLWTHQLKGGFEDALAELQTGNTSSSHAPWAESQLIAFQNAVGRMFEDMNGAFLDRKDLEFQRQVPERMVEPFLMRFDAIFSLNQDLLLEQFYFGSGRVRGVARPYIPGMRLTPNPEPTYSDSLSRATLSPVAEGDFRMQTDSQPFFKLHGSSNWFGADGRWLLIMGGAKQQEIGRNPILKWYAQQFSELLLQPNSRLMVIGYGFRDQHVNDAIEKGVTAGLKLFVIDPAGAELAFKLNETRQRGQIIGPSAVEDMLKRALTGGSRRGLSEIFGVDGAEFPKIMRFFDA